MQLWVYHVPHVCFDNGDVFGDGLFILCVIRFDDKMTNETQMKRIQNNTFMFRRPD